MHQTPRKPRARPAWELLFAWTIKVIYQEGLFLNVETGNWAYLQCPKLMITAAYLNTKHTGLSWLTGVLLLFFLLSAWTHTWEKERRLFFEFITCASFFLMPSTVILWSRCQMRTRTAQNSSERRPERMKQLRPHSWALVSSCEDVRDAGTRPISAAAGGMGESGGQD